MVAAVYKMIDFRSCVQSNFSPEAGLLKAWKFAIGVTSFFLDFLYRAGGDSTLALDSS